MLTRWRVRRGIAFLDQRFGRPEWLSRVDLDELDVTHHRDCPLAQASGLTFWHAAERQGFDSDLRVDALRLALLGFLPLPGEAYATALTSTWREEILRLHHIRESENTEMEILL